MSAVRSLAKRGEKVFLSVDNTVAWSYFKKGGGKKPHINLLLRPFLKWCMANNVQVYPILVKSEDQKADQLSRWNYDVGDYTLQQGIFLQVLDAFKTFLTPDTDMFASPGNTKFPQFVSRWPHFQSIATDALKMDLSLIKDCYANPPWNLILPWLEKLRRNPHVNCLAILPYWVGNVWWPLLLRLLNRRSPVILVKPREGLFINCLGQTMPPTRWPLICVQLSGNNYRENKFHLKITQII
jgi:hypothetical protein